MILEVAAGTIVGGLVLGLLFFGLYLWGQGEGGPGFVVTSLIAGAVVFYLGVQDISVYDYLDNIDRNVASIRCD